MIRPSQCDNILYRLEQNQVFLRRAGMRQREFDTQRAIAGAMDMFWRKGYKGASMSELLRAMGIGKGSFYAAFGSKRKLFLLALKHFRDTTMLVRQSGELLNRASAVESLRRLFERLIERTLNHRRTCLFGKTALEFRGSDPDVAEVVQAGVAQLEDALFDMVVRAQVAGEITPNRDPRVLAKFLVATYYGVQVLGSVAPCRQNLKDVVVTALAMLDTKTA